MSIVIFSSKKEMKNQPNSTGYYESGKKEKQQQQKQHKATNTLHLQSIHGNYCDGV